MNIFLTGASGFVGNNLLNKLNGHNVYCFKRGEDPEIIIKFNPDVIFHIAAELYNDEKMFESNIKLTYNLLNYSKNINYKNFIYVGSSSEYGEKNSPIKETDFLSPRTMYEATKGCGSLLCQSYSSVYKKTIMVARPFSLYGIGQPENKLMPAIYNAYKKEKELKLSDGTHDWIYIDDFTDGLLSLMYANNSDIINFGSGIQHTNSDVLKIFEKILNTKIKTTQVDKMRTYDSNCWICDVNYAKNKYGFSCKYYLEEGIEKYVKYRENSRN